jgi:energy-coupling factor transporter ATP-binding protein EcfA2
MKVKTATSEEYAIEAKGLERSFGENRTLAGVDLKIAAGEYLVIFGPNGAGKTTLLKVLSTLMKPSAGTVLLEGADAGDTAGMHSGFHGALHNHGHAEGRDKINGGRGQAVAYDGGGIGGNQRWKMRVIYWRHSLLSGRSSSDKLYSCSLNSGNRGEK